MRCPRRFPRSSWRARLLRTARSERSSLGRQGPTVARWGRESKARLDLGELPLDFPLASSSLVADESRPKQRSPRRGSPERGKTVRNWPTSTPARAPVRDWDEAEGALWAGSNLRRPPPRRLEGSSKGPPVFGPGLKDSGERTDRVARRTDLVPFDSGPRAPEPECRATFCGGLGVGFALGAIG